MSIEMSIEAADRLGELLDDTGAPQAMRRATMDTLREWSLDRAYHRAVEALERLIEGDTQLLDDGGCVQIPLAEGLRMLLRTTSDPVVIARSVLVGAVAVGGGSPDQWPAWRQMVDYGHPIRPDGGPGPFHPIPGLDTPNTARRLYAPLVGASPAQRKLGTSTRGSAARLQATYGAPAEFWGLPFQRRLHLVS